MHIKSDWKLAYIQERTIAPKKNDGTPYFFLVTLNQLILNMTQFQNEGGGLVQGVNKLITILFTSVTLNKKYAN